MTAASLLLHGLVIWALLRFERAPDAVQAAREIPVEVMVEPAPPPASAPPGAKATEKPGGAEARAKGEAEKQTPPPLKAEPESKATEKPGGAEAHAKGEAEKQTPPSKAEPEKSRPAETKPAEPPAKAAAAKDAPEEKNAKREKSAAAAKQARAAAVKEAAQQKLAPDQGAGNGGGNQLDAQTGLKLPFDMGPEIFRAVATPLPVEGGEEEIGYKQIVFGLLERAKHFPEAALARGARGAAVVRFSVDDAGQVTSVSLLRSSGEPDLDDESIALVQRAAPFPTPPAGAQREFAAQINFGLGP